MTWAQRLKRVFNIDIEICGRCGGSVRVIADASDRCIEDQDVIPDKAGLSIEFLLICAIRNRAPPTCPTWHHHPGHRPRNCLFSPGRIPDQQHPISKEARETAWHERLRALVHDGPDRNDIPNAANRIFG
jgi:hypothetical protein